MPIGSVWRGMQINILDIRQNEKDKETSCSACMCYGLTWTFCMNEEALSSFLHGMKLVLLPHSVTMAVDIGSRSRDSCDDAQNLFAT